MMPRLSYAAGYSGDESAFSLLFPAAQTFTTPAFSTAVIASLKVVMCVINTCVDDGYDDVTRVRLGIPGCWCGNLRHIPLVSPARIRWSDGADNPHLVIGLGINDIRVGLVSLDHFGNRKPGRV